MNVEVFVWVGVLFYILELIRGPAYSYAPVYVVPSYVVGPDMDSLLA